MSRLTYLEKKHQLREKELAIIFKYLGNKIFTNALELGAGDGFQSQILIDNYVEKLVCTDLNSNRLEQRSIERIEYKITDAEYIDNEFDESSFDFVFASNLLEHLPKPEKCISAVFKILKEDGVFICSMPNRFFTMLQLLLFFPMRVVDIIKHKKYLKLFSYNIIVDSSTDTKGNNLKSSIPQNKDTILKYFFPKPHGVSQNFIDEFRVFGKNKWVYLFNLNGFFVEKVIKLPVYSPYLFTNPDSWVNLWLEKIGFSSSYAFVLKKTH